MSTENPTTDFQSFVQKYRLWIILGVIALVVMMVIGYIAYTINVRNEGERQEQDLTALYGQSINSLSTCFDQGEVAAQVTEREYESIKDILVGAVSARYVDEAGNPTNASAALGGGQLISALQEQYPNIDQRSWQNLQTLVIGCRDEFQGKQDRIQSYAANYNKWRVSEDMTNFWVKAEFPSNALSVSMSGGGKLYGQDAYDQITRVVSVDEAITAFETGELESQELFPVSE